MVPAPLLSTFVFKEIGIGVGIGSGRLGTGLLLVPMPHGFLVTGGDSQVVGIGFLGFEEIGNVTPTDGKLVMTPSPDDRVLTSKWYNDKGT